jgi:hypothetical protein
MGIAFLGNKDAISSYSGSPWLAVALLPWLKRKNNAEMFTTALNYFENFGSASVGH